MQFQLSFLSAIIILLHRSSVCRTELRTNVISKDAWTTLTLARKHNLSKDIADRKIAVSKEAPNVKIDSSDDAEDGKKLLDSNDFSLLNAFSVTGFREKNGEILVPCFGLWWPSGSSDTVIYEYTEESEEVKRGKKRKRNRIKKKRKRKSSKKKNKKLKKKSLRIQKKKN